MTESVHEYGSKDNPGSESEGLNPDFKDEDSVFADLREEVLKETADDIKWYIVPERPTIELGFSVAIEYDLFRAWVKRATDRKTKNVEAMRLATIILSNQTRGIRVKGNEVMKDGEPCTLQSNTVWGLFDVNSMPAALTKIMKRDGHIIALMQQVIEDAGYGDVDMEASDPLNKD